MPPIEQAMASPAPPGARLSSVTAAEGTAMASPAPPDAHLSSVTAEGTGFQFAATGTTSTVPFSAPFSDTTSLLPLSAPHPHSGTTSPLSAPQSSPGTTSLLTPRSFNVTFSPVDDEARDGSAFVTPFPSSFGMSQG